MVAAWAAMILANPLMACLVTTTSMASMAISNIALIVFIRVSVNIRTHPSPMGTQAVCPDRLMPATAGGLISASTHGRSFFVAAFIKPPAGTALRSTHTVKRQNLENTFPRDPNNPGHGERHPCLSPFR